MTCKLIILDEVNIKLEGVPVDVRRKIVKELQYEIPYAKFLPAYKLGRWDGTVPFFNLSGTGYLNHLNTIILVLSKNNIVIEEIEDRRNKVDLKFPTITESFWKDYDIKWPKGHVAEYQHIELRNHQVDVINSFLQNPQSLQSVATGAGKCLGESTYITIYTGKNCKFNQILIDNPEPTTVKLTIGDLALAIQEYTNITLIDNQEIDIKSLDLYINSPFGKTPINFFIKKCNLPIVRVLVDNYAFYCASKHILQSNGLDIYAEDLISGDYIDAINGPIQIHGVYKMDINMDCYDIAVNDPYLYYDSYGILHHNTIITATLSKLVEPYGRSLIIVPNTSLVVQTERDYKICNLDVGVYYGNRKDIDKTHTICTWQSLNVLDKKSKKYQPNDAYTLMDFLTGVSTVIVDECFAAHTPILTPNGLTPIKFINVGDTIINYCEQTKQFKSDQVVKVHRNLTNSVTRPMFNITFSNKKTIQVTGNHKLLTTIGWKKVETLTASDTIIAYNDTVHIISKEIIDHPDVVYNLHIKNDHNYIANSIIASNCHQAKADILKNLLTNILNNTPIRWGLTGTIPKEKYEFESLHSGIGPIINHVSAKELQEKGILSKCHINIIQLGDYVKYNDYPSELKYLVTSEARMTYIASIINKIKLTGNTLVLVDRIAGGEILKEHIPNSFFVSGDTKLKNRSEAFTTINEGDNEVVIATYGLAAVGIDIPRLFNVVLLEPGKSFVRVIQSIGRGVRKAKDKDFVQIWDIASNCRFSKRHLNERIKFYKEAHYRYSIEKRDWDR